MDLSTIEALNPTFDETRALLVLELDHGKANEMGSEQIGAFEALCGLVEGDDRIRCLCTTSRRVSKRGKPIFIAGANVTERSEWDDQRVKAHVLRQRALMRRLRHLPIFTVAITHGVTLGWGAEFLLTADYTLGTPAATIGLPETGLGIVPGARGTAELAAVIGPAHALRLGCTGEQIGADEAVRIGMLHESVADVDAGIARVRTFADLLTRRSPTAVAAFKRGLLDGLGRGEDERLAIEARAYAHCVDTGEAAKGRAAFAAVRDGKPPQWGPRRA